MTYNLLYVADEIIQNRRKGCIAWNVICPFLLLGKGENTFMWKESLYTDGTKEFVSNPLPKLGETVTIYLRVWEDSPIDHLFLRTKKDGLEYLQEMTLSHVNHGLAYYSCELEILQKQTKYYFYVVSGEHIFYYNQLGVQDYFVDEIYSFCILADYEQPSWVKDCVFYQIYPDRFYNGNPEIGVKEGEYEFLGVPTQQILDWTKEPEEFPKAHCVDFYGGDLWGIQKKIPYLRELGVDALYLTPIFKGETTHRYDCNDYYQVDEHLGGNEALISLSEALHENDMKLILDISINHTGTKNCWFHENKDFYYFQEDGTYGSYYGVTSLAKLNYGSKELREQIYAGTESVLRTWLREPFSIDGWRFDVGSTVGEYNTDHFGHEIWPEIRAAIKEENPQAYVMAEDWNDSYEFLQGNEWDGIMNFIGCGRPVREYAGQLDFRMNKKQGLKQVAPNSSAHALAFRIMSFYGKLPYAIWENQFNMLDCHDVSRLHNDPSISFEQYKIAVYLQYFLPGCVCLYYGDELGIGGRLETTEGCRYPMDWKCDKESNPYFQLYTKLNQYKHTYECLRSGGFKILLLKGNIFVAARFLENETILLMTSMEDEKQEISIDLTILGNQWTMPKETLFGEPIKACCTEDEVRVTLPGHAGYLIKLIENNVL